jgi:hypothetical protein
VIDYEEFEESLTRLDSIDAARVIGDGKRVTEVHIVARPDKAPKQVVRDVQSLAMARYGASIDRRVVSVVRLTPDKIRHPVVERPALVGVKEDPIGSRVDVRVTLGWQNEEHVGRAHGPTAASARLRLIGEATLAAVESLDPDAPPLALDAIGESSIGMRTVVTAIVVTTNERSGEETSVGSVLGQGDLADAAVKAVLDALNRRLSSPE